MVTAVIEPIIPGRGTEWSTSAHIAVWLWATSLIALVIAALNVVSPFAARGLEQRRETAVRLALGCDRARLVRRRLAESLAVAIPGAVAGLLLSRWSEGAARALLPELRDAGPLIDARVLLVSLVLTFVCALVTGVIPALTAARTDVSAALKADGGAGGRSVYARGLLALQIADSLALLIAAGAFTRSLGNLRRLDVGYQSDRLVVASMDPSSVGYTRAETDALFDRMRERVRATAGVAAVAVAWSAPTAEGVRVPGVKVSGGAEPTGARTPRLFQINGVTEEYLRAAGIPLRAGRWISAADRADTRPVVVINEPMARTYFPAGDAIGHCLTVASAGPKADPAPCREIVGVVGATRADVRGRDPFRIYAPLTQRIAPDIAKRVLVVVVTRDPRALILTIRRVMQGTAPDVPFAYAVTRRRRELGIRIALGAPHRSVVGQLLGECLRVAGVGTILGVGLALAASGALGSLLYGVAPMDALVVAVAVVVVLCAVVGATLPAALRAALRATRVDPRVALSLD